MTETISFIDSLEVILQPWFKIHNTLTDTLGIPDIYVTIMLGLIGLWVAKRIFRLFAIFEIEDWYWFKRSITPKRSKETKQREVTLSQKILSSIGLVKIKRIKNE